MSINQRSTGNRRLRRRQSGVQETNREGSTPASASASSLFPFNVDVLRVEMYSRVAHALARTGRISWKKDVDQGFVLMDSFRHGPVLFSVRRTLLVRRYCSQPPHPQRYKSLMSGVHGQDGGSTDLLALVSELK